jgi:poly(3-hydroxybutyrate) depolymerase
MRKHALLALYASAYCALLPAMALAAPPLPPMAADMRLTSVSGISSGGFMAAQLATAFSSRIMGVGIIAAGPYYCAGTYPFNKFLINATTACMSPLNAAAGANAKVSWDNATALADAGKIDPVDNLQGQRVYLFSGRGDQTVKTEVVNQVALYYALAKTTAGQIHYRQHPSAGHAIITEKTGVACADTGPPFINQCGFMQSHDLLRHIYGAGQAPNAGAPAGRLLPFDQREFVKGDRSSMDEQAYVYIPDACNGGACAVHVAFHGCKQGATQIGELFYKNTGFNEYADSNRIIVLYPQAHPSNGIPFNPQGCWDFWGYSSADQEHPDFHHKDAPQMSAIMRMVERLGQARAGTFSSTPQ